MSRNTFADADMEMSSVVPYMTCAR